MSIDLIKSAAIRAVRTFVQTFLALVAAGAMDVVDVATARALAVAAGSAALAAAWRAFIDPSPIPSLVDPYVAAGEVASSSTSSPRTI